MDGILSSLNGFICKMLVSAAAWLFNMYYYIVGQIGDSSFITGSLSSLFGSNGTVWGFVQTVHQVAVIPLAESILALFMLVQLVKISQRIDATSTLPAVKDIVFLFVTYVIMHWLIVHSLDIVTAVYDAFNSIAKNAALGGANPNGDLGAISINLEGIDFSKAEIGSCLALIGVAVLSVGTGVVAYIVANVVCMARGVQIYVMATFSPIPLSLLGFDETRQMGISFLKNLCAVALSGAIIMFLLTAYPYIVTSVLTSVEGGSAGMNNEAIASLMSGIILNAAEGSAVAGGAAVALFLPLLTWVSSSILLILGLVKSGSWAKDVLGG